MMIAVLEVVLWIRVYLRGNLSHFCGICVIHCIVCIWILLWKLELLTFSLSQWDLKVLWVCYQDSCCFLQKTSLFHFYLICNVSTFPWWALGLVFSHCIRCRCFYNICYSFVVKIVQKLVFLLTNSSGWNWCDRYAQIVISLVSFLTDCFVSVW